MQNKLIAYILGLIRPERKLTIKYEDEFIVNELVALPKIRHYIDSLSFERQIHASIENEDKAILIQRNKISDEFLVCTIRPYSSTNWELNSAAEVVSLINENRKNSKTIRISSSMVLKRAIEGKRLGEY